MIEFGQYCDLDGARLRKYFIFAQIDLLPSRKIFDGKTHYAVEVAVDVANLGFQLVPENLLLFGELLTCRGRLCHACSGEQTNHRQRQSLWDCSQARVHHSFIVPGTNRQFSRQETTGSDQLGSTAE